MRNGRSIAAGLLALAATVGCTRQEDADSVVSEEESASPTAETRKLSRQLDAAVPELEPGDYRWHPEVSPNGPLVILVSIPDQLAKVYRNGIRIGVSTVSTGRPGHETPTGVFHILEKDQDHVSNLFPGAKMPNMERLTWTGIALHAGNLPGYPASHGCVRMPLEFSRLLFEVTEEGGTVVIADEDSAPSTLLHPGLALAVEDLEALEGHEAPWTEVTETVWRPDSAPEGPVSLLISGSDRTVYVYRNGELIGRSPVAIEDPDAPLPVGLSTMLTGTLEDEEDWLAPGEPAQRWMAVSWASDESEAQYHAEVIDRVHIPETFARDVHAILTPGAILMTTHLAASEETTTGQDFVIVSSHHEAEAPGAGISGGSG